mmetsp:Transcript_27600/g.55727  ORF Transcript_27600/g.55727 Transcript_27600/m.55727 type:complete len:277 (-) Transcript_27600:472-1302(-)
MSGGRFGLCFRYSRKHGGQRGLWFLPQLLPLGARCIFLSILVEIILPPLGRGIPRLGRGGAGVNAVRGGNLDGAVFGTADATADDVDDAKTFVALIVVLDLAVPGPNAHGAELLVDRLDVLGHVRAEDDMGSMPISHCRLYVLDVARELLHSLDVFDQGIIIGTMDAAETNLTRKCLGMVLAGRNDLNLSPDQTIQWGDVFVVFGIAEGATSLLVEGGLATVEIEGTKEGHSGLAHLGAAGLGLVLRLSGGLGLLGARSLLPLPLLLGLLGGRLPI